MHYITTIELQGTFKEAFNQVFEEVELLKDEMPLARQEAVQEIQNNLTMEDSTLLLGLSGANKQEKPLVIEMLTVALNAAKEMAKVEEDTSELKRLAKVEQTLVLFKNTGNWNTAILNSIDEEADEEPED